MDKQKKIEHLAFHISQKIAVDPKRVAYQNEALERQAEAWHSMLDNNHISHSQGIQAVVEHLDSLSKVYSAMRNANKEITRAQTEPWLLRAIRHFESTNRARVDKAASRKQKNPVELTLSATRTNPDPESYFRAAIESYLAVAPQADMEAAERFALDHGVPPLKEA